MSFSLLQSCNQIAYQGNSDGASPNSSINVEGKPVEEPPICCVCLDPLEGSREVIVLGACNHSLHHPCIDSAMIAQYDIYKTHHEETGNTVYNWTQAKPALTCPYCRTPITDPILLDTFMESLPDDQLGIFLSLAVIAGDRPTVVELLKKVKPNGIIYGEWDNTLLHLVKNPAIAQLLIDAGADPNAPNTRLYRPLHIAAQDNNVELIKLLLNAKADVDSQIDGLWTPLHFAVEWGNIEAMKLLIASGTNLNAQADLGFQMKITRITPLGFQLQDTRLTPLHLAALLNKVEASKLLIDSKANLEVQAIFGCTPLAMAVLSRNKNFRALIPYFPKRSSETACDACIAALQEAGANVEETNALGLSLEALQIIDDFPL
ncbi:MAG: ankyrin repeat domain-containing protein [Amoebophilaceae bacterium]|nr:ankyrin repeat domain-containing protein [Amoebophilaceae bacterium]